MTLNDFTNYCKTPLSEQLWAELVPLLVFSLSMTDGEKETKYENFEEILLMILKLLINT